MIRLSKGINFIIIYSGARIQISVRMFTCAYFLQCSRHLLSAAKYMIVKNQDCLRFSDYFTSNSSITRTESFHLNVLPSRINSYRHHTNSSSLLVFKHELRCSILNIHFPTMLCCPSFQLCYPYHVLFFFENVIFLYHDFILRI